MQFQKRLHPSSQQTLQEVPRAPALDHINLLTRHHHHRHLGGNCDGEYHMKQRVFDNYIYIYIYILIFVHLTYRGQHTGNEASATSKERQLSGDGVTDHEIRLKLGGFSGRASR